MKKKRKPRITVEYEGKIEHCGSIEMAIKRFRSLTKEKPCNIHVLVRIDGLIIAECIPLIVNKNEL